MPKLTILVGPPGAGKTTYAKDMGNAAHVSQDDQGLGGQMDLFEESLKQKKDIVVDRMNFNKMYRSEYLKPAKDAGYSTEIVVFHVPSEVCLNRCIKRKDHIHLRDPEIAQKAISLFMSKYERVTDDEADAVTRLGWVKDNEIKAIICDIDGTIANVDHRAHLIDKKNWNEFFEEASGDSVNEWCGEIISAMSDKYPILYITGRKAEYLDITTMWLEENGLLFPGARVFTRQVGDNRKDDIVKEIILDFEVKTRYNVLFAIEDRSRVVKMWRKNGHIALQCADGDF